MAKLREVGEAQARRVAARAPPGVGDQREIAVGEGQEDEFGRALAEVDRLGRLVQRADVSGEKVHGCGLLAPSD